MKSREGRRARRREGDREEGKEGGRQGGREEWRDATLATGFLITQIYRVHMHSIKFKSKHVYIRTSNSLSSNTCSILREKTSLNP